MNNFKTKLLKNTIWNWIFFVVNATITFLISPLLVHYLGNERYGFWTIAVSLIGYYGLLDIGIRNALVRYIAKYHAEKKWEKLNEVVNTGFTVFVIAACTMIILSLVLSLVAPKIFSLSTLLINDAKLTILIVGITFAIQFPLNALSGILIALQRFDITSKINIIMVIIQNLFIFIALKNGFGLVTIALIIGLGGITALFQMAFRGIASLKGLKLRITLPSKFIILELLGYSFFVFIIGLAGRIFSYTTPIIIGARLDLPSVAFYSIPVMMVTYATNIVYNFCRVLQPYASSTNALGNEDQLQQTTLWSTRISLLIYLPIAVLICFIGKDFIRIWIRGDFAEAAKVILPIIACTTIFSVAEMPLENILMGIGKVRLLSVVLISESVISIILIIILLPLQGLVGAAWGTGIPLVISRGIVIPLFACKILKIRFRIYYWEGVGRSLLLILPLIAITLLLNQLIPITYYGNLMVISVITLLTWGILILMLTPDGRLIYKNISQRFFERKIN